MATGEMVTYQGPGGRWKPTGLEISRTADTVRIARWTRNAENTGRTVEIVDVPRAGVRAAFKGASSEAIRTYFAEAPDSVRAEIGAMASSVGVTVNDPARAAAGVARATQPRSAASASAGSTGSS